MVKSSGRLKKAGWLCVALIVLGGLTIEALRLRKRRQQDVVTILSLVTNLSEGVKQQDQSMILSLLHPVERADALLIKEDLVKTFDDFRPGLPAYPNYRVSFHRNEAMFWRGTSDGSKPDWGTLYVFEKVGSRWFLTLRVVTQVD